MRWDGTFGVENGEIRDCVSDFRVGIPVVRRRLFGFFVYKLLYVYTIYLLEHFISTSDDDRSTLVVVFIKGYVPSNLC